MNIKDLAEKYELTQDDFWELRKNSGKWIITHDACEKIAQVEGIVFEPPQIINYQPTVVTENGEKLRTSKYGREVFRPAWAGTCQKKSGDVAMVVTGYKLDNPDYKIWTTGEANALNCTAEYYLAMAEKRAKDRAILKLINAYEYGIYSDVESDDFKKKEKKASQKQVELIIDLASEVDVAVNTDGLTIEEASNKIEELKEAKATKDAIDQAQELSDNHKQQMTIGE